MTRCERQPCNHRAPKLLIGRAALLASTRYKHSLRPVLFSIYVYNIIVLCTLRANRCCVVGLLSALYSCAASSQRDLSTSVVLLVTVSCSLLRAPVLRQVWSFFVCLFVFFRFVSVCSFVCVFQRQLLYRKVQDSFRGFSIDTDLLQVMNFNCT